MNDEGLSSSQEERDELARCIKELGENENSGLSIPAVAELLVEDDTAIGEAMLDMMVYACKRWRISAREYLESPRSDLLRETCHDFLKFKLI
ncbi:MAG: hypothetical protein A3B96_02715 [Candidatus Spechtbacteria bacterium RIFCSPHIGHO2_02_FULL_43_15b]|nr:MAG: hypothetical protein A3B96_02715 [Candidatus Spechtbacteria bacterium RIFCSPHIGHO2_02_FULL_43_15b]